jgi:hypothetical protein
MTRLRFILASVAAVLAPGAQVPVGADELNRFALAYNRYLDSLRQGVVDVRLWRKVCEAWRRLTD